MQLRDDGWMDGWMDGMVGWLGTRGMEGWQVEGWQVEGWKGGRVEGGRVEGWKDGKRRKEGKKERRKEGKHNLDPVYPLLGN